MPCARAQAAFSCVSEVIRPTAETLYPTDPAGKARQHHRNRYCGRNRLMAYTLLFNLGESRGAGSPRTTECFALKICERL